MGHAQELAQQGDYEEEFTDEEYDEEAPCKFKLGCSIIETSQSETTYFPTSGG